MASWIALRATKAHCQTAFFRFSLCQQKEPVWIGDVVCVDSINSNTVLINRRHKRVDVTATLLIYSRELVCDNVVIMLFSCRSTQKKKEISRT